MVRVLDKSSILQQTAVDLAKGPFCCRRGVGGGAGLTAVPDCLTGSLAEAAADMPRHASSRSRCAAVDGRHGAPPIEILTATRDDALMLAERVRRHFTCVLGGRCSSCSRTAHRGRPAVNSTFFTAFRLRTLTLCPPQIIDPARPHSPGAQQKKDQPTHDSVWLSLRKCGLTHRIRASVSEKGRRHQNQHTRRENSP